MLKIAVFVMVGVVFLGLVRKNAPSFGLVCEILLVGLVVISVVPEIENLISVYNSFDGVSEISENSLKIMFKAFGILVVGAIVGDVCRDNGEGALAGAVEIGTKILAISCSMPVFSTVIQIALTFF